MATKLGITGDPDTDRLLSDDPFAPLVGMLNIYGNDLCSFRIDKHVEPGESWPSKAEQAPLGGNPSANRLRTGT
jgi:hypothetical protein